MEGSHEVIEGCYNPDMTRCAQEKNAYVEMGESRPKRMDNFLHGKQMRLKSNAKTVGRISGKESYIRTRTQGYEAEAGRSATLEALRRTVH